MVRGKHCEYKAMLKKTDIEPMVIEAIREIVRNEEYAQAIKKRIGVQIDTKAVDKELEGYQAKLKEVDLNKTRLEREIDSLPADAKYRERKLHDMTLRLDSLYDVIVELEEKIEDARLRRDAIKQQAITLENIYKIMVNFDCVYNIINDEEKRNVVTALIKEIEIYRNDESEYPLKRIGLNFPVFKDGGEVTELLWDKGNTVETTAFMLKNLIRTGYVFTGWTGSNGTTPQTTVTIIPNKNKLEKLSYTANWMSAEKYTPTLKMEGGANFIVGMATEDAIARIGEGMPNFGAANFKSVDLDGKPIDPKFYQVRNGSIILTIEKAFLNTLSAGEHALNVQLKDEGYEGQTVSGQIVVSPVPDASHLPKTGDDSPR